MPSESVVSFRTLDGLHLAATLVTPDGAADRAVVSSTAAASPARKAASLLAWRPAWQRPVWHRLRFDLRGHGESEGRQEDLTLATILNDIRVALASVQEATGACSAEPARRQLHRWRLRLLRGQADGGDRPPGAPQPAARLQAAHDRQPPLLARRPARRRDGRAAQRTGLHPVHAVPAARLGRS